MRPPEAESPFRAEWELLHSLRAAPELLAQVVDASGSELHVQKQLRRQYSDPLVRAAFALCELRRRAKTKFSRAAEMWFDRVGLEQATAEPVARHKAARFRGPVCDLCCGIGGDTLALAQRGDVRAIDLNPCAGLRTQWNAEVYAVERRVTFECANAVELDVSGALVHLDPDRRAQRSGRAVRIEDYEPGPEFLERLMQTARGGAIKLSPAANFVGRFPEAEIELISLEGECKEATLWFGELRGDQNWRATVLPAGATIAGDPLDAAADVVAAGRYIFDPDPAVVRAGLVDVVAGQLGLNRLDREEEYLAGDAPSTSPFVQAFEVIATLPNRLTEIRAYFRASRFGQVEIKCRRIPVDADSIRRRLPLSGDEPVVLIFARVEGRARAVVARRFDRAPV